MSTASSQEYRNIKALVVASERLDNIVIEASREAFTGLKPPLPTSKSDVNILSSHGRATAILTMK